MTTGTGSPDRPGGRRARAAWSIIDQGLSSLGNASMAILVARATSPTEFGRFAFAFAVYGFAVGVTRAIAVTPFVLRLQERNADGQSEEAAAAGLSVLFGLLTIVPIAIGAGLTTGSYGPALACVGLFLPALCLQEFARLALVAEGRPARAALIDGLWLALQVAAVLAWTEVGEVSATTMIVAWALPGALSAAMGARFLRIVPRMRSGITYLRRHLGVSKFLVAEWVTIMGGGQLVWFLIAFIGDEADIGALRGALTLLGPQMVLLFGFTTFALPEFVRRREQPAGRQQRDGLLVSAGLALTALVWGGITTMLPNDAGTALLGDTWANTQPTLLPMTLYFVGMNLAAGPVLVIRARAETRTTFFIYAVQGLLLVGLAVAGQLIAQADGAAWGYAASALLPIPLWLWAMRTAARRRGWERAGSAAA